MIISNVVLIIGILMCEMILLLMDSENDDSYYYYCDTPMMTNDYYYWNDIIIIIMKYCENYDSYVIVGNDLRWIIVCGVTMA